MSIRLGSGRQLARLEQRSRRLAAELGRLVVRDRATAAAAAGRLRALVAWRRRVRAWFQPLKQQVRRLHQELCARERAVLEPVAAAEAALRERLAAYLLAERAQQQAAARAAGQAAQQAARRLGQLAERACGDQPASTAVPAVAVEPAPRAPGVGLRRWWAWRPVGDERRAVAALARAAQQRPALLAYLRLNEPAITAAVRRQGDHCRIPGIEIVVAATAVVELP